MQTSFDRASMLHNLRSYSCPYDTALRNKSEVRTQTCCSGRHQRFQETVEFLQIPPLVRPFKYQTALTVQFPTTLNARNIILSPRYVLLHKRDCVNRCLNSFLSRGDLQMFVHSFPSCNNVTTCNLSFVSVRISRHQNELSGQKTSKNSASGSPVSLERKL
jgi:hypothetical protein